MTDPDHPELDRLLRHHTQAATPTSTPGWSDVLTRRRHRRTRRLALVATACAAIASTAILVATTAARETGPNPTAPVDAGPIASDTASDDTSPAPTFPPVPRVELGDQPPEPLILTGEDWTPVDVTATCWQHEESAFCSDGLAQPPYVTAVPGAEATFAFPLEGWSFSAVAQPLTSAADHLDPCTRFLDVTVTATGRAFQAIVEGPAGLYLVHLQGQGPQGSVSSSFAWTTTTSRPTPPAEGYLALLTDNDGELDSYGVELGIRGLDRGYPNATATVAVTTADGLSQTYGPYSERDRNQCDDGSVSISSPQNEPMSTSEMGPGPYRYRVELTLGDQTYVGTAIWPRDERADEAPNTDLVFRPPLPRYAED